MAETSPNRWRDPLLWLFMGGVLAPLVVRVSELSGADGAAGTLAQSVQDASALTLGTCCILCAVRGRGYGGLEVLSRGRRVANAVVGLGFFAVVLTFRVMRAAAG